MKDRLLPEDLGNTIGGMPEHADWLRDLEGASVEELAWLIEQASAQLEARRQAVISRFSQLRPGKWLVFQLINESSGVILSAAYDSPYDEALLAFRDNDDFRIVPPEGFEQ